MSKGNTSYIIGHTGGYIITHSGQKVYPLKSNAGGLGVIRIDDIAHALSNIGRFTGHSNVFESVAQHSVLVSQKLEEWGCDAEVQLQGLLHDASEAYLNDIARPVKYHWSFWFYRRAEKKLQKLIYKKFDLPLEELPEVKEADKAVFNSEVTHLFDHKVWENDVWASPIDGFYGWYPPKAEGEFMRRFIDLEGKIFDQFHKKDNCRECEDVS